MNTPLRYGIIGCGGFGRFCVGQYRTLPELHCALAADVELQRARAFAEEFNMEACSPDELLRRADIDIVHIATPPVTHGSLALAALENDKHVLCEKPLAITLDEARRLLAVRDTKGLVLAVDMMMRYNPLCLAVRELISLKLLGDPLHAHFVNDARDEILPPDHWFWDPAHSGGIFVEHGVHFFDLFEWWFGPGTLLSAHELVRPGTNIVDQVNCTAVYEGNILVNFYHGFHQAGRRDRQRWLIVFENGTLEMDEWVPTTARIDFLGTDKTARRLMELFEGAVLHPGVRYVGAERVFSSRHRPRDADGHFILTVPESLPKWHLYGMMVRNLMLDQIRRICDPRHQPATSHENGYNAVRYAVEAQRLAGQIRLP
jgi:predicted dehydrogenase